MELRPSSWSILNYWLIFLFVFVVLILVFMMMFFAFAILFIRLLFCTITRVCIKICNFRVSLYGVLSILISV